VSEAPFTVEALGRQDRASFSCGDPALDRYVREQARQDQERRASNCFVLVERATGMVVAYCTLSSTEVAKMSIPSRVRKKLAGYPTIPAALIGRLAVDSRYQRQRLGEALLAWATEQMQRSAAACALLVVDAYPEAAGFYRRFGFRPVLGQELRLYYPLSAKLQDLAKQVAAAGEE